MPSYDNKVLTGDQLVYFSGLVKTALAEKASTSAVNAKQDTLVFNTAYNASTNKVATMADIPTTTEYTADLSQTMGEGVSITSKLTAVDGISSAISNSGSELYKLTVSAFGMKGYDNLHSQEVNVGISDFIWKDSANSKQVSLTPGSGYDGLYVNGNKVATVADINTAIGGIEISDVIAGQASPAPGEPEQPYFLDFVLDEIDMSIRGKQDRLVFNTAYNENTNKVATMSDITSALSNVGSFSFEIVQSLPSQDISTSKIYLVAKQTSGTNQVYTEYAYVNNGWEIIGDTAMTIDTLSNQEVATIWNAASAT